MPIRAGPHEIARLDACDIVLANMWRESIGTTAGSFAPANKEGQSFS
jgi:hypothetical protein